MLWENDAPSEVLTDRFGFHSLAALSQFVGQLLVDLWGLHVTVTRVALSDKNAIVWVSEHSAAADYVVKASIDEARFARLSAIAGLLGSLEDAGLAVVAPLPTTLGEVRVRARQGGRDYSVIVQPHRVGTLLADGDERQAHAAGRALADLHLALAAVVDIPVPLRNPVPDPVERIHAALGSSAPVPCAKSHLRAFLDSLPDRNQPPVLTTHLIHDDFRGANVIVNDGEVSAILDFDEMLRGYRVADLARSLTVLATEFRRWEPAPPKLSESFLSGYCQNVSLTKAEWTWLPILQLVSGIGQAPAGSHESSWSLAIERLAGELADQCYPLGRTRVQRPRITR